MNAKGKRTLEVALAALLLAGMTWASEAMAETKLAGIVIDVQKVQRIYMGLDKQLDLSGLSVTAQYADGSEREVRDYTVEPAEGTPLHAKGPLTVTIGYCGKSESFLVLVAPDGGKVTFPDRCSYYVGEKLDLTGFRYEVHYGDPANPTETYDIALWPVFDPPNGARLAQRESSNPVVMVRYEFCSAGSQGLAGEFPIHVFSAPTPQGIFVEATPVKTSYAIGERLDMEGLVVVAEFSDGRDAQVFDGVTTFPPENTVLTEAGQKTVLIVYTMGLRTYTANVQIEVRPTVASAGMTGSWSKAETTAGEPFDLGGMF